MMNTINRRMHWLPVYLCCAMALLPLTPAKGDESGIRVGVEYALPGQAQLLAPMGVPAVKFLPDLYTWGKMQAGPNKPINFTVLDGLVREYQQAGFTTITLGLTTRGSWAIKTPLLNFAPKPEFTRQYAEWVRAIVERYDGDGKDDMPGLRAPIHNIEIGVELSTYEPEPIDEYLTVLTQAAQAARAASPDTIILHAAFLTTTAFRQPVVNDDYGAAFAQGEKRVLYHPLADMRKVLDHPELFDAVNLHAIGDPYEIEAMVSWVRWEMAQRGYTKPIILSDTSPTPFIAWGPASIVKGKPEQLGLIIPPATEADRPRLAAYFQRLLQNDADTVNWTRGIVACDMVEKTVIAAEQKVALIDTAFTEDIPLLKSTLLQAGAGNAAWGGMCEARLVLFDTKRKLVAYFPSFYAIRQLQRFLDGYQQIERIPTAVPQIRLYRISRPGGRRCWIAWLNPERLLLPGDAVPSMSVTLPLPPGTSVTVETIITEVGVSIPTVTKQLSEREGAVIQLSPVPVMITAGE